jgi:hypothetical protein
MCGGPGIRCRPGRDGFAVRFIQDIAAAMSVAAGQNRAAPPAAMPRPRAMGAQRPPHTMQLCVHCRQNLAGFSISRTGAMPARRPWCLSCCRGLDPGRYHLTRFDGRGEKRRCR